VFVCVFIYVFILFVMSTKLFQDLYVTSLQHRSMILKDQLENGLYVLKRTGAFLKKVCSLKKNAAIEVNKMTEHEKEKKDRVLKDRYGEKKKQKKTNIFIIYFNLIKFAFIYIIFLYINMGNE
jgi:hypothetical protein